MFTEADIPKIKEMLGRDLPNPEVKVTPNFVERSRDDVVLRRADLRAKLEIFGDVHRENKVGSAYFYIIDKKTAELGLIGIDSSSKKYQGLSYGKTILQNIRHICDEYGIVEVKLEAMLVGGYVWAKYGFVPYQNDWDILRYSLCKDIDTLKLAQSNEFLKARGIQKELSQEEFKVAKEQVLTACNSSDPKAIWLIADSVLGNELLSYRSWHGTLNLNDPRAMVRFDAYVVKGRAIGEASEKEVAV